MSFSEAEDYCAHLGMHLASIHNQDENIEATSLCTDHDHDCWIGLYTEDQKEANCNGNGTAWKWTDGSAFNYSYWNINEPNDYGKTEHCVHMYSSGAWNDNTCTESYRPMCRIPDESESDPAPSPTMEDTSDPSAEPTAEPIAEPTAEPIAEPNHPTHHPTSQPIATT